MQNVEFHVSEKPCEPDCPGKIRSIARPADHMALHAARFQLGTERTVRCQQGSMHFELGATQASGESTHDPALS
jgi:hypothetical protein